MRFKIVPTARLTASDLRGTPSEMQKCQYCFHAVTSTSEHPSGCSFVEHPCRKLKMASSAARRPQQHKGQALAISRSMHVRLAAVQGADAAVVAYVNSTAEVKAEANV